MRTILLMRHGEASEGGGEETDHERPLTEVGMLSVQLMGSRLQERELAPDAILSSTAVRAVETAQAVAQTCRASVSVQTTKRLYLAEPAAYFDLFSEVPSGVERLLVVAHNPGIADVVEILTGHHQSMGTATIAHVALDVAEISRVVAQTRGRLADFLSPSGTKWV